MFDNSVLDKSIQISDIQKFLLGKEDEDNISFKFTQNLSLVSSPEDESSASEPQVIEKTPPKSRLKFIFKLIFLLSFPFFIRKVVWLFEDYVPESGPEEF